MGRMSKVWPQYLQVSRTTFMSLEIMITKDDDMRSLLFDVHLKASIKYKMICQIVE